MRTLSAPSKRADQDNARVEPKPPGPGERRREGATRTCATARHPLPHQRAGGTPQNKETETTPHTSNQPATRTIHRARQSSKTQTPPSSLLMIKEACSMRPEDYRYRIKVEEPIQTREQLAGPHLEGPSPALPVSHEVDTFCRSKRGTQSNGRGASENRPHSSLSEGKCQNRTRTRQDN